MYKVIISLTVKQVPAVAILAHFICHIVTCTIDPAVASVRKWNNQIDKHKDKRVNENEYCDTCQVQM